MNQADFGALGGVGLQTQSRYEKAETEPAAAYLAGLAEAGVDVLFVLTGRRVTGELMDDSSSRIVDSVAKLASPAREALLVLLDGGFGTGAVGASEPWSPSRNK